MTPESVNPEACADLYLMQVWPGEDNHIPRPHWLQKDWLAMLRMGPCCCVMYKNQVCSTRGEKKIAIFHATRESETTGESEATKAGDQMWFSLNW